VPRKPSTQPNDVELAILRALWDRGPSTVRQVHDARSEAAGPHKSGYTSTLKMMQVMCDKGLLVRDESQRPQVFRPAVPEAQTQRRILADLIQKVFGGSARALVQRAVETEHVTPADLAEIRKLLKYSKGEKP